MNKSVFGITKDEAQTSRIVDELQNLNFSTNDISVLFPDRKGTKDFAHEKKTKAPEGATAGGITGGVVGGTLGLLAGIGALAIPGLGPFIAAGPLMAALAGSGVGGAIGGLIGLLIGLGIPEFEAKRYAERIKGGNILIAVTVRSDEQENNAKKVFKKNQAEDVCVSTDEKVGVKGSTERINYNEKKDNYNRFE